MQTSGTCAPLSDGVKKTIVGATPPARRPAARPKQVSAPKASTHRAGGHAKHARRTR